MFYQRFPITSRYHSIETATFEGTDGRSIVYLRRRFLPDPDQFALLQEHRVAAGERPDHLAARYLNDPEQFWRLADANGVMNPDELTDEIGRVVRITLPEGIPGAQE
jgi:hypothetical protein